MEVNKMAVEKRNISVNHPQQQIEKNIDWRDYPCMNTRTERKLRKNLGYYFESWKDYITNGDDPYCRD